MARRCSCGLWFIPLHELEEYCDTCQRHPEDRAEVKHSIGAMLAKAWRDKHKDQINARRRAQRRARRHHNDE